MERRTSSNTPTSLRGVIGQAIATGVGVIGAIDTATGDHAIAMGVRVMAIGVRVTIGARVACGGVRGSTGARVTGGDPQNENRNREGPFRRA